MIVLCSLFLIFICISLWLIIYTKGFWWVKIPVISVGCFFLVVLLMGLSTLNGWPSDELPEKFEVNWIKVKEPSALDSRSGIYVWVSPLEYSSPWYTLYSDSFLKPYNVELPYSKQGKKQAKQILKKLKKGEKVYGSKNKQGQKGEGSGDGSQGGSNGPEGLEDGESQGNQGNSGIAWIGHDKQLFYVLPGNPSRIEK